MGFSFRLSPHAFHVSVYDGVIMRETTRPCSRVVQYIVVPLAIAFGLGAVIGGIFAFSGRHVYSRCVPIVPCCSPTSESARICEFEQNCINLTHAKTFVPHWTCDYDIAAAFLIGSLSILLFVTRCCMCCQPTFAATPPSDVKNLPKQSYELVQLETDPSDIIPQIDEEEPS
jgi:hypothetical protein